MWSLGILMVDLMKGRTDENSDTNQTSSDKKNLQTSADQESTLDETANKNMVSVSKEGRNVIAGLIRAEPSQRLTLAEVE